MGANGSFVDLTGKLFGNLTALSRVGYASRNPTWLCRCTCGQEVVVRGDRLRGGLRKSCARHGHFWRPPTVRSPGLTLRYPAEYKVWRGMRERCERKNNASYSKYGGIGVRVCAFWKEFKNFFESMGPRPSPAHSIDRYPDCRGNYEPLNCRWATKDEQKRNMRNNVWVEHEGERLLLIDLLERVHINKTVVRSRLNQSWSLADAITVPVRPKLKNKKLRFSQ
jgi:hypothetical protein